MKIFVTGAAGFMGQATMKLGETLGHTMKGCDLVGKPDLNVVEGSITDLEFLKRETKGFDAIIHTASRHTGDMKAGVSNADFYAVNVTGSDNVFLSALA
ncbi:MAG: NAD-dependent epimerase/dehydratase family protein, partial [Pirellulaceae bacterium]|nr:NAD-dependent epimerase/dehydratase family protein [Pirellulaceae bacterium]